MTAIAVVNTNQTRIIALAANGVKAEMVEAMEFSELSDRFNVRGVPRIVINDDDAYEGAIPAQHFVEAVLKAGC